MTSASAPSSEASQGDSPPETALSHSAMKRVRMMASNAASLRYQRAGPASRQKPRISAGATSRASVMDGLRAPARSGGRGLLLVAQFTAQDLADIGFRQA